MQTLQIFNFDNQAIKIQNTDSQVWFCAADVCRAIGYKNPAKAIADNVSPKHNRRFDLGLPGRKPIFISEAGIYELILRSNLPAAVPFRDWVCEQVLPAIRRTGTYTGRMPLTELVALVETLHLPALIAQENSAPPDRAFKVRDIVTVEYGNGDQREAMILDFLGTYVYVKLATGKMDFVVVSQVSIIKVNHNV